LAFPERYPQVKHYATGGLVAVESPLIDPSVQTGWHTGLPSSV